MKAKEYLLHLPEKPYCTNSKGSLYIRKAEKAVEHNFIQPNHPSAREWMIFDSDSSWSWFIPEEVGLPAPTYTAVNRTNGHAHIAYLLEKPVGFHESSREGPMKFYKAVERAFRRRLGADAGYSGFITKNPCNTIWETDWNAKLAYRLDELNDCLDPIEKKWEPKKTDTFTGVGRNVMIFDIVRDAAYRKVLKIKKENGTKDDLYSVLAKVAMTANLEFPNPLWMAELKCIVRSVVKWVWDKFTVAKYSIIQSFRSKKRWTGVSESFLRPWEGMGISRATYYTRKKAGLLELPSDIRDSLN